MCYLLEFQTYCIFMIIRMLHLMTARLDHCLTRFCLSYLLIMFAALSPVAAQTARPVKVLVVGANDPYHSPMATAAEAFFQKLAKDIPWAVDFTRDFNAINETN